MAHQFYKTKLMELFNNICNDFNTYNRLSIEIDNQIKVLKKTFYELIIKIKNSSNFSDSENYFDELEKIQGYFATIIYKFNYKNDPNLLNIVKDFDRLDTIEERNYWFDFLKKNEYEID